MRERGRKSEGDGLRLRKWERVKEREGGREQRDGEMTATRVL